MQHVAKKLIALAFLLFLGLWVAGVVRGWSQPYPEPPPVNFSSSDFVSQSASNYQVASNLKQLGLADLALPLVLDQGEADRIQVFEKTAHLACGTAQFEDDEALIRYAVTAHKADILSERGSGIVPDRRLTLEIGIHPDQFDAFVEKLRQVGRLDSVAVQKRDRTSEFRKINAERQALKTHADTIMKLRGAPKSTIDDELKLEQQLRSIEKELLTLSGKLGDLVGRESFYHVHLTLTEYQPGSRLDRTYSIPQRLAHAAVWAAAWWVVTIGTAAVLTAAGICLRMLISRSEAALRQS